MILNPRLYNRLKSIFGIVKISNMGEPLRYHFVIDPVYGKRKLVIDYRGEAYCVNCPYCIYKGARRPDHRFRLYINHRWLDTIEGISLDFLVKCYNENCLEDSIFRDHFKQLLFSNLPYKPVYHEFFSQIENKIELPKGCRPLQELEENHPARNFLIDRGFDLSEVLSKFPVYFGQEFDCTYPLAFRRIILPCTLRGQLIGWQARKVFDDYVDSPKYYTARHSKLSHSLYGFDQFPKGKLSICFLVEGIFDVWAVGEGALGLFGTHLSMFQTKLLRELGIEKAYILLDADAKDKVNKIAETLKSSGIKSEVMMLAEGDPADLLKKEGVCVKP